MNASMIGWGAVCGNKKIHGFWDKKQRKQHINFLELKAVGIDERLDLNLRNFNALKVDNTTAISYINKMGGIKYQKFNCLAKKIWKWAESRNIWM